MEVWKSLVGSVALACAPLVGIAADLTPIEMRWLKGAWPVVVFAKESRMPLDIVVQPQATPGASPMALAYVDNRCKLVLSMRGNAEAQATLDRIPPDLIDAALELMAAHELGHCRRYLDGAWFGVPAGFVASVPATVSADVQAAYANMSAVRREEGYGDLVGLAWTEQRHPQLYERLRDWLLLERARNLQPGSHHDTLVWLRLTMDGNRLAHGSIFKRAQELWTMGLSADD